jgi:hypothetical protein
MRAIADSVARSVSLVQGRHFRTAFRTALGCGADIVSAVYAQPRPLPLARAPVDATPEGHHAAKQEDEEPVRKQQRVAAQPPPASILHSKSHIFVMPAEAEDSLPPDVLVMRWKSAAHFTRKMTGADREIRRGAVLILIHPVREANGPGVRPEQPTGLAKTRIDVRTEHEPISFPIASCPERCDRQAHHQRCQHQQMDQPPSHDCLISGLCRRSCACLLVNTRSSL